MINIKHNGVNCLAEYIYSNYGIHLKDEKKSLVMGRLQNVLMQANCQTFSKSKPF